MSQKINPEVCRQNKRLNLLLSETDAVYHEAAKRMGLADSDMKILYTILAPRPHWRILSAFPASASKQSIPPCASWKSRRLSICKTPTANANRSA